MTTALLQKKKGFTLTELLISMAMLLIVFGLIAQLFIQLNKVVQQIEINRELTVFTSNILTTLSTDLDEYMIDTHHSTTNSLWLQHPVNTGKTTSYTTKKETGANLFPTRHISNSAQDYYYLERTYNNGVETIDTTYRHPYFGISGLSIRTLPTGTNCDITPTVLIQMDVHYIPKSSTDYLQGNIQIQTAFTTPEDPILYHQHCTP